VNTEPLPRLARHCHVATHHVRELARAALVTIISAKPMMSLSGVRSSWLMLAEELRPFGMVCESHLPRVSCFHYGLRSRIFDQTDHTVSHRRGSYMSFASRGGRAGVKASYPAGVVACRGLGSLQSRRHRPPLP
jgi:hypothetical protein